MKSVPRSTKIVKRPEINTTQTDVEKFSVALTELLRLTRNDKTVVVKAHKAGAK